MTFDLRVLFHFGIYNNSSGAVLILIEELNLSVSSCRFLKPFIKNQQKIGSMSE